MGKLLNSTGLDNLSTFAGVIRSAEVGAAGDHMGHLLDNDAQAGGVATGGMGVGDGGAGIGADDDGAQATVTTRSIRTQEAW